MQLRKSMCCDMFIRHSFINYIFIRLFSYLDEAFKSSFQIVHCQIQMNVTWAINVKAHMSKSTQRYLCSKLHVLGEPYELISPSKRGYVNLEAC